MRVKVFHSDKGDCLLLTSSDGKHVLADGGMAGSFSRHVAPELGRMAENQEKLDLVYVSHIDQDHIAGILKLMGSAVDWRVHAFQHASGNSDFPEPRSARAPDIGGIWHNAFHEQVGRNAGPIEDMLAANAALLSTRGGRWAPGVAQASGDLATSMNEAVRLSRRVGAEQLDIPLNEEYGGQLMFVEESPTAMRLGNLRIFVIGPFAEDLEVLRRDWNRWLRSQSGRRQLRKIREDAREDERRLGTSEFGRFVRAIDVEAAAIGDRDQVTPPNLASLMLLVEDQGESILLTGDGHADDILAGLDACGKLDANGRIHVDVLKVAHHGSENNTTPDFARRVTANHYVFCGNGAHENPDLRVVKSYIDARRGSSSRFTLHFNASARMRDAKFPAHMRQLEQLVARSLRESDLANMRARFLRGSSFTL